MQNLKQIAKTVYLNHWKPAVKYVGVFYGEVAQLELAVKFVFLVAVFCNWRGYTLNNSQLVILGILGFGCAVLGGWVLEYVGAPQRTNQLANELNPELKLINRIADKLGIHD